MSRNPLGEVSALGAEVALGVVAAFGEEPSYGQGGGGITDFTVDAGESSVFLSAATVVTGETLTLTIVARNAAGQGLPDKAITSVTLAPVGAGTVTGSGNTSGAGVATRTIEGGDVAAGNTVTVVCDSVSITQVPTFAVTAAPPPTGGMFADNLFVSGLFVEGMFV